MKSERGERLLLKMLESAGQLDAILAKETAHQEVFQPESLALRSQLEQLSIQLILLSPRHYGSQAEDLLWKKVYLQIRNLRKTKGALMDTCSPEGAYQGHLRKGIDVYHRIFFAVQDIFQLKLESYIDWTPSSPVSYVRRAGSTSVEARAWARKFCHGCLVHIGNLYHYQGECLDSPCAQGQAETYYYKALMLIPEIGLPFLHLATLSGTRYFSLEATYFYHCCIYSEVPCVRASWDLELVYSKVEAMFVHLRGSPLRKLTPEQKQYEDVKRLLVSFLYLQYLLQPRGRGEVRPERLGEGILEDFGLCLSYRPIPDRQRWGRGPRGEQEPGSFLTDQVLFQMVILCILTVHSLQEAHLQVSKAATDFALAFFTHLVHHAARNIQAELQNKQSSEPDQAEQPKPGEPVARDREPGAELPSLPPDSEQSPFSDSDEKPHLSTGDDALADFGQHRDSKEVSDLDGNCASYRVLDDSDDWGDVSFSSLPDVDGSLSELLSEAGKEKGAASGERAASSSRTRAKGQRVQEKLDVFSREGLLPTIKVILQWLQTDPALTSLSMCTCPSLWRGLLVLLNLMPRAEELQDDNLGLPPRLQKLLPHFEQPDSPICMPLPEDVILHSLLPFRATHQRVDFGLDMPPPFSREEVALRACTLRTFGHFATHLPESLITFDPGLGLFIQTTREGKLPALPTPEERAAQSCIQKKVVQQQPQKQQQEKQQKEQQQQHRRCKQQQEKQQQKQQQHWKKQQQQQQQKKKQQQKQQQKQKQPQLLLLKKELEVMERHLHQLQLQTALSPYLILDCLALCQYLPLIREMGHSGRFIIVVPRIVIDELDATKEKSSARRALKFLEDELKKRSRYLRCQVEVGQKFTKPMTKGADASAWNLYGILRTYGEGAAVAGAGSEYGTGTVTVLTALSVADCPASPYPLKLALAAAHKAGVYIKHILTFYAEWKQRRGN